MATPLVSEENPISKNLASTNDAGKMKVRLIGMIKAMKKIDLTQAPAMLGIDRQVLQQLLFELVGEDKVNGEFQDENTFIITSGVDNFITALNSQFSSWNENEQSKQGKI